MMKFFHLFFEFLSIENFWLSNILTFWLHFWFNFHLDHALMFFGINLRMNDRIIGFAVIFCRWFYWFLFADRSVDIISHLTLLWILVVIWHVGLFLLLQIFIHHLFKIDWLDMIRRICLIFLFFLWLCLRILL